MFLKVRDYMQERIADFPPASIGGILLAALVVIISTIAALAGEQLSAKGEFGSAGDIKGDARDALHVMLKQISGIAKSMAYTINGLENKFRLPYSRSEVNLVAAGRAFAADAVEYKPTFIEYGLPDDFIEDLTAATDAFETARTSEDTAEQDKIGSTASFAPHIGEGMIIVRRLDPIIKMKYGNDAAAMAAWTFAKHVERAPQASKPPATPSTP
jgi:hypothetical protein